MQKNTCPSDTDTTEIALEVLIIDYIDWNPNHWILVPNDEDAKIAAADAGTKLFISDMVTADDIKSNHLNLIVSGCGAGKTHFVLHKLPELYPDIKPEEIMITTSRAITAQQQSEDDGVDRVYGNNPYLWYEDQECDLDDGDCKVRYARGSRVCLTTYASFAKILRYHHPYIKKKKIIVIDECHSLYVDLFMGDAVSAIKDFIANRLDTDTILIAISATPEIVENKFPYPHAIHYVLGESERIQKYSAENIYCTYFDDVPNLLRGMSGKSIVMCENAKHCSLLRDQIPYSYLLYGRSHTDHTPNMGYILDFIAKWQSIPTGILTPSGSKTKDGRYIARVSPINALISTTVMREGFNIHKRSEVENVVCCSSDPVDIIQFAGRCRFNIKNLIIAPVRDARKTVTKWQLLYDEFFHTKKNNEWTQRVIDVVSQDRGANVIHRDVNLKPSTVRIPKNEVLPFEAFMFDNFVSDSTKPLSKWKPINKKSKERIADVARSSMYYEQRPSKFSVVGSLKYFADKFNIDVLVSKDRQNPVEYYFVPGGNDVRVKYEKSAARGLERMLFVRYVNDRKTQNADLRAISIDEYLDIKTWALNEMILGSRNVDEYSIERILNRFCEMHNCKIVEIEDVNDGVLKKQIALVANSH